MRRTALIIDDQEHVCNDLKKHLQKRDYTVFTALNKEEARKIILSEKLSYVIIDLKLSAPTDYSGIQVFNFILRNQPDTRNIILSAYPFEHAEKQLREASREQSEQNYIFKGGDHNYIKAVLEKLEEFSERKEKKKCFVILPFTDTKSCNKEEWDEIFEKIIKPAVEESGFNYRCIKPVFSQDEIIEPVLDELIRSELVIADLTDQNPNVLYELGVRHSLRDSTIIITQSTDDIPFDPESHTIFAYGWKIEKERQKLERDIREMLASLEEDSMKIRSPVQTYLNP